MSEHISVRGGTSALVEVRELYKSFGTLEVLRGVSLKVHHGEVAALIGSSGGGKSTLLRCVAYLEPPDAGLVLLHDKPFGAWRDDAGHLVRMRADELRRGRAKMPMVFQQFNLFQHMTSLENVARPQRVVLGRKRKAAHERAMAVLESVGLAGHARAYPSTLSGGQQQRVAIARALAMDPDVLLLDEPTSSLDPELKGEVVRIIRSLADSGMPMILATHEMSLVRQVADRVYFLDSGVIVESGDPADVFDQPRVERTRDFLASIVT